MGMLFFSVKETLIMLIAAIVIDWIIGDPRALPHPVIYIGRLIKWMEQILLRLDQDSNSNASSRKQIYTQRMRGAVLVIVVTLFTFAATESICIAAFWIHPWLGYAVQTWLISTTIAIKGLKDAALLVYTPLMNGDLHSARKYVGEIVGRDTDRLNEQEVARAAVETVAENIVDAVVSPLLYACIGAAPLAMLYRAVNTLDSMVGYKNERYLHFGWASARMDDALNLLSARLTGIMLVLIAGFGRYMSARSAWKAVRTFAHLHPSPNSGIPEAAVAGALGIQLGGTNMYKGVVSERVRMGWPKQELTPLHIIQTIRLLYRVSYVLVGGLLCALCLTLL